MASARPQNKIGGGLIPFEPYPPAKKYICFFTLRETTNHSRTPLATTSSGSPKRTTTGGLVYRRQQVVRRIIGLFAKLLRRIHPASSRPPRRINRAPQWLPGAQWARLHQNCAKSCKYGPRFAVRTEPKLVLEIDSKVARPLAIADQLGMLCGLGNIYQPGPAVARNFTSILPGRLFAQLHPAARSPLALGGSALSTRWKRLSLPAGRDGIAKQVRPNERLLTFTSLFFFDCLTCVSPVEGYF
jgi:hypothetical protein